MQAYRVTIAGQCAATNGRLNRQQAQRFDAQIRHWTAEATAFDVRTASNVADHKKDLPGKAPELVRLAVAVAVALAASWRWATGS